MKAAHPAVVERKCGDVLAKSCYNGWRDPLLTAVLGEKRLREKAGEGEDVEVDGEGGDDRVESEVIERESGSVELSVDDKRSGSGAEMILMEAAKTGAAVHDEPSDNGAERKVMDGKEIAEHVEGTMEDHEDFVNVELHPELKSEDDEWEMV